MSDTSIETRINRLEWSMEQSQLRLKEIDDTQSNLKKSIYSIERSLLQIRYFIMGGISILLIIEMGLMSFITKLF